MRGLRIELVLLGVVALLWGSAFVAIRAGLLAGASPFLFAALRYAAATGVIAAAALATRQARPSRGPFLISSLLGGVCLMGAYAALVYWGEQYSAGGLAAVLVSTAPIWTAIVSIAALPTERLHGLGWVAIALGFVGVVLLFLPDLVGGGSGNLAGLLALITAAAFAAVGSVGLRRLGMKPSGLWNLTGEFGVATIILVPLALLTPGGLAFPVNAITVGTLIYLAIGSSVFGYGLYFVLLERVGPARANVVAYLNPIVGLSVGFLLLGESVTPLELGGFALILLAVASLQLERRRAPPAPAAGS
ncbi:MAG TPA: EamA family transporter [Thermoplasmata archaeon]|nr:EamA family transporter [Thermoplasmata archaeon]